MTKEEEIADLESQLTGDMFADMDIKDEIHRLKLEWYLACALKQFKTIISYQYEKINFTNTCATFLNLLLL